MRLLKFTVSGLDLFADNEVSIDLYATDRVAAQSPSVFRMTGAGKAIHTQNLIGVAGLNASGKTTMLRLLGMVLSLVRGIPLRGDHLVYGPLTSILQPNFSVTAILADRGNWYLLESSIRKTKRNTGIDDGDPMSTGNTFEFAAEHLWKHHAGLLSKKEVASYELFKSHSDVLITRNVGGKKELSDDSKRYLSSDTSVISGIIESKETVVSYYFDSFRMPFVVPSATPAVIKTFDSTVDQLDIDDDGKVHLRFSRDDQERVLGQFDAAQLLSVGTMRGTRIINSAIDALSSGGYFLVDEIENSLNKQLVETIMDIFASPITNPRGATLVFTTHYPELLDHLTRKDDVYFSVRDKQRNIRLVKYSDHVQRVEPKKSEIFFANLIKGTAPKAKDVTTLREYIKDEVRDSHVD